jgi:signal transduction histidine kinase
MTHETQNVACQHTIAARTALEAFRHQQPEAGLDWSSFDTAVGLLDQTIEELRRPVHSLQPTELAAGGFPAAMAYLIEETQTAAGPASRDPTSDLDAGASPVDGLSAEPGRAITAFLGGQQL